MRCLNKNKQTIHYKNYIGKTQIVDTNGNRTGEYTLSYSDLIEAKMNVSASRGVASEEMFGIQTNYTKVLVTSDINCSMDEHSIVWIDKPTDGPHDYVVVRKAKSLNSIAYAILEVSAGEAQG